MLIANFLFFQLAWFSCVLGAAYGMPWLGVAITIATIGWHLSKAKQVKPEVLLLLLTLIIGAGFDQLMLILQWVGYQHHGWSNALVPVWILALWAAFACTLNVSLAWLKERYFIAMLFGAAGGPIAYLGAEKIGAVNLHGNIAYIALSIGWAVITPLLFYFAKHLNGFKVKHRS
ncbi:MAG: DUF2878 domain-containing protein [Betaproteobacteria bacterium HGW-Betaproteobacteria-22]|nr:MAG: DUF2878 domain-containing protein [Betaproteobacteria bacterium HGW-Betaproteobacteria-22]